MAEDGRQIVKYTFFKVDPAWRRLPAGDRRDQKEEFVAATSVKDVQVRSYTTVGLRGDADLVLWVLAPDLETVNEFHASLNRTVLAGWLTTPYSYLAMTRRSPYVGGHRHEGQEGTSTVIQQTDRRYLFIYPFVKTHAWYWLPPADRQRMMNEHFRIGHSFPTVKINTAYSFGLDDQDFVLGFETDSATDFLDLVMQLRSAEQRPYTERDVPIFSCIQRPLMECLEALG